MCETRVKSIKQTFRDAVNGNEAAKSILMRRFGNWGYYELLRVYRRSNIRWRKVQELINRWAAVGSAYDTVAGEPSRTQI